MKDDIQGELTYKDRSCIDYFLLSKDMYPLITQFNVQTFNPLLSDGHSAVILTLSTPNIWQENVLNENENDILSQDGEIGQLRVRWASDKKRDYISQLNNNADLEEVINELDRLIDTVNVDVSNINNVTNQLTEVLINGAKSCGMVTQTNPNNKRNHRKKHFKWFNKGCLLKKGIRGRWRDNKNGVNLEQMKQASKNYKRQINRAKANDQEHILSELKSYQSKDPNKF